MHRPPSSTNRQGCLASLLDVPSESDIMTLMAGRTGVSPGERTPRAPSTGQQKTFIVENANILNRETKLAILSIVMMEIGPEVVMETGGVKEVDIDLDAVTAANEEVLRHIYNIVLSRRKALSRPLGHASARSEHCNDTDD